MVVPSEELCGHHGLPNWAICVRSRHHERSILRSADSAFGANSAVAGPTESITLRDMRHGSGARPPTATRWRPACIRPLMSFVILIAGQVVGCPAHPARWLTCRPARRPRPAIRPAGRSARRAGSHLSPARGAVPQAPQVRERSLRRSPGGLALRSVSLVALSLTALAFPPGVLADPRCGRRPPGSPAWPAGPARTRPSSTAPARRS
jgi:hypothetical protein